jgi:hypothetical protein
MKNTALLSDREIYNVCKADYALSAAVHKALDLKVGKLASMKVRERDWDLVEFQNPDFAARVRACRADGCTFEDLDQLENAFCKAPSGRATMIDAPITRWAIRRYSPPPEGVIQGTVEAIEERQRNT